MGILCFDCIDQYYRCKFCTHELYQGFGIPVMDLREQRGADLLFDFLLEKH